MSMTEGNSNVIDESQNLPGEPPAADATPSDDVQPDRDIQSHPSEAAAEAVDQPAAPPQPPSVPQTETATSTSSEQKSEPSSEANGGNGGIKKDWYILKVQSNREDAIAEGLQRRVAIAGLQDYFGEIIVPTEMVTEFKGGKKRVVRRKLYPGYIVVNMAITDDTWFLVRDTPGIGDFTGAGGKPIAMQPHEIAKLIAKQEEKTEEQPRLKISFKTGDRVKINEGTFENFEGEVENIDETNGRVTVMINIFGRSTPVELEYWQVENI
jgi:transcriptional antiterminator NusG